MTFARFCRRLCFAHRFYSVYLLLVDTPHMHCSLLRVCALTKDIALYGYPESVPHGAVESAGLQHAA